MIVIVVLKKVHCLLVLLMVFIIQLYNFVTGTLNGGIGHAHVNKVLSALNIPVLSWKTFQRHEKEIGPLVEEMAKESCKRALAEEREMTIKNIEKIKAML